MILLAVTGRSKAEDEEGTDVFYREQISPVTALSSHSKFIFTIIALNLMLTLQLLFCTRIA